MSTPPPSVLFATWNGGGNVAPVLVLASELTKRGAEVVALGEASLRGRFESAGVPFAVRDADRLWDPLAMAQDVEQACRRERPALAVVDYMMPAAMCGAEAAGTPVVALVHTLFAALLEDGAPAPISMTGSIDSVNEVRAATGLGPCISFGDLLAHTARVLVTCPRAFDLADPPLPENVRYVAPLFEEPGAEAGWKPPTGDEPLVVVSMGTTPMDEAPVLQRVLNALGQLPVRVVATVGDHLAPADIDAPENCRVSGYVPHAQVLPHASAVVTHGGLGTVLASFAHDLPVVCLPLGREQPDNAAAVERVGAGVVLSGDASAAEIAAAVDDVLHRPDYAGRAREMQRLIAAGPSAIDELVAAAGLEPTAS